MRLYLNALLILVALSLTIWSGVLHGRYSHRWGGQPAVLLAAERLAGVPETFGDWKLQDSSPLAQPVIDELQCAGYLNQRYVNSETGEAVTVAVLVGPPGPISVHTPEICYSSREFQLAGERRVESLGDAEDRQEFWAVDMQSRRMEGTSLRVYYAWMVDGGWRAVKEPRFTFAGKPLLFKIQLSAPLLPGPAAQQSDTCLEFLKQFVPELNRQLFGSSPPVRV